MLEIVDETGSPARLKVIGVGGGGSNAVNRMIEAGLRDVEFWVANTDKQALDRSPCLNRLQIGRATTRGLGAGGDPEMGRLSAEEDQEAIEKVVSGADMIFITAGMGGGTGTGAAPVIARYAREMGVLAVAIVTKPFSFEGRKKLGRAMRGLDALAEHVDTLISIPNQKLMHIVEPGTSFSDALLMADEVLFQATRGISDLIMGHGIINLDFADVRTVMRDKGNAMLGSGMASGKDRAIEAAQAAVSSPLLEEVSIEGAEALLVNIQGGTSMSFHEAAEAAQFIADRVGDEADVFWGAVVDPSLDEEIRVTLIATGFPGSRRLGEQTIESSHSGGHRREMRGEDLRAITRRREAERYDSIEVNLASGPASARPVSSHDGRGFEATGASHAGLPGAGDRSHAGDVARASAADGRRDDVRGSDGRTGVDGFGGAPAGGAGKGGFAAGGFGSGGAGTGGPTAGGSSGARTGGLAAGGSGDTRTGGLAAGGSGDVRTGGAAAGGSGDAGTSGAGMGARSVGAGGFRSDGAGSARDARGNWSSAGGRADDRRADGDGTSSSRRTGEGISEPEPVLASDAARGRSADAGSGTLRGADEGLRGGRGYEGTWRDGDRKNGNRKDDRGSHRNPLDVPTYLRKPVDD
ncbi:MAG: cell division protein FtsZ [Candidatus Eisenbacteria bacterium]